MKKSKKISWIEAIQFSKFWYDKYFPKDMTKIDRWRIIQSILCGYSDNPEWCRNSDILTILDGLYLKYILKEERGHNVESHFWDLISFDSLLCTVNSKNDAQEWIINKMFSGLSEIQVKEKDENGKWIKLFPIGTKNWALVRNIKKYFKNKENK